MISAPAVAVTLLLLLKSVTSPCSCSESPSSGVRCNFSSQGLNHIPDFPPNTTELYLQRNQLFTVPPGFFDRFLQLRVVDVSANPFHCDCRIQYLRLWLLKNQNLTAAQPTCTTPTSQADRAIISLNETYFSSCVRNRCTSAAYNLVVLFLLCGNVGLLLWSLCLAKDLSFILGIGKKHAGLKTESLRSLKPKHRLKVRHSAQWDEDLETPLLEMEILPQIIETLHRRHNIKIKEI